MSACFLSFGEIAGVYLRLVWGDRMSDMRLDPEVVGRVIGRYRKRRNLSQEVLSGLADIGRTHLSAIERGERKPTLETLYRISLALDVKMSDIVTEIEQELGREG